LRLKVSRWIFLKWTLLDRKHGRGGQDLLLLLLQSGPHSRSAPKNGLDPVLTLRSFALSRICCGSCGRVHAAKPLRCREIRPAKGISRIRPASPHARRHETVDRAGSVSCMSTMVDTPSRSCVVPEPQPRLAPCPARWLPRSPGSSTARGV